MGRGQDWAPCACGLGTYSVAGMFPDLTHEGSPSHCCGRHAEKPEAQRGYVSCLISPSKQVAELELGSSILDPKASVAVMTSKATLRVSEVGLSNSFHVPHSLTRESVRPSTFELFPRRCAIITTVNIRTFSSRHKEASTLSPPSLPFPVPAQGAHQATFCL